MARLLDNVHSNVPDEFHLAVGIGAIPQWAIFRKFGMNDAVSSGREDMWPLGTVRVLPATAGVVTLTSSDAADTMTSGTGAWNVRVEGLDENYYEISEDVDLAGLSNSASTAEFLRINRMYILQSGTTDYNEGNITATIGGAAQSYIEFHEGQTHQSMYTVPANKHLMIDHAQLGVGRVSGSNDVAVQMAIKPFGLSWRTIADVFLFNGQSHATQGLATLMPGKTELRMQILSSTTTQAYGIFAGYLITDLDV